MLLVFLTSFLFCVSPEDRFVATALPKMKAIDARYSKDMPRNLILMSKEYNRQILALGTNPQMPEDLEKYFEKSSREKEKVCIEIMHDLIRDYGSLAMLPTVVECYGWFGAENEKAAGKVFGYSEQDIENFIQARRTKSIEFIDDTKKS